MKRRHTAQGSPAGKRVNLYLTSCDEADATAAELGISRSAYVDMLIHEAEDGMIQRCPHCEKAVGVNGEMFMLVPDYECFVCCHCEMEIPFEE